MSEQPVFRMARAPKIGSAYYLPKNIFRSVVAFCLSYPDLKRQLNSFNGLRSQRLDGMPRGSGTSDPTAREAERLTRLKEKIFLIENAVRECASDVLYPWMIRAVTEEGCSFSLLQADGMPINRNQYIVLRRKIFYEIAKEM